MSDEKLSLHIGQKNNVTLTSGFWDVSAVPVVSSPLSLNRQTVVGFGGGPAEVGVTGGATRTVGRTTGTNNSTIERSTINVASCYSVCLICCDHYA